MILLGASGCAAFLAIVAARTPSGAWSPYPLLAWPSTDAVLLVAPMLLMLHLAFLERAPRAEVSA